MELQTNLEENKKTITPFHNYFNKRDWEKLKDLLHEDFSFDRSTIIPDTDGYYQQKREYTQRFMLAIFDPKTRESGIGAYEKAPYDYEVETIYLLNEGKIIDVHRSSDNLIFFMQLGGLRARTETRAI